MADEPVIAIDSEDEADEATGDEEAAAAAAALAAARPLDELFCQLILPPSRGLTTPQPVGNVQVWLDREEQTIYIAKLDIEEDEEEEEGQEAALMVPTSAVTQADVKADGRMVILSLSPPLAPTGFAADWMAEGHRLSMVAFAPAPHQVLETVATLRLWLGNLTVYGPRALGLPERPQTEEPLALRFHGVLLDERDVALLEEEQWLNDTIMDFFLRLAVELAAPKALADELYVAKTQFFTRLTACGAHSGEKGWENVKTWTRSVCGGIASQRVLVYPINEANLHWCMFFVCHPRRAMEIGRAQADENSFEEQDLPRMVCFDSAWEPAPKDEHVKLLKGYLRRELVSNPDYADIEGEVLVQQVTKWRAAVDGLERMESLDAEVPKQKNVYDCGIFVLEFLLYLLRRPSALNSLGVESHRDWFSQALISHRRVEMRNIVERLQQEARGSGQADVAVLLESDSLRSWVTSALLSEPPPEEAADRAAQSSCGGAWLPPQPKSTPHLPPQAKSMPPQPPPVPLRPRPVPSDGNGSAQWQSEAEDPVSTKRARYEEYDPQTQPGARYEGYEAHAGWQHQQYQY